MPYVDDDEDIKVEEEEEEEEESVGGLVREIKRNEESGERPRTGQRVMTSQAQDQGENAKTALGGEPDQGMIRVGTAKLAAWLNDETDEVPNDMDLESQDASDDADGPGGAGDAIPLEGDAIAFENVAMRDLLLGDTGEDAPEGASVKSETPDRKLTPTEGIKKEKEVKEVDVDDPGMLEGAEARAEIERMEAQMATLQLLVKESDQTRKVEGRNKSHKNTNGNDVPKTGIKSGSKASRVEGARPNSGSRPNSRASKRALHVDCESGGITKKGSNSGVKNSLPSENTRKDQPPPKPARSPPGSSSPGPASPPKPPRATNTAKKATTRQSVTRAANQAPPRPSKKQNLPDEKEVNTAGRKPISNKDKPSNSGGTAMDMEHTITAANASLLASMLETEEGGRDYGNNKTLRMRREVRAHRPMSGEVGLDHPSLSKQDSGRDIGGETRQRAKELHDLELEKQRGSTLRSGGRQRPRAQA